MGKLPRQHSESVHVILLPGLSLPRTNDVSLPILCDISPLVQHISVCDKIFVQVTSLLVTTSFIHAIL